MAKQKQKVYVLVRETMTRGEQCISLQTFDNEKKAKNVMKVMFDAELNDWKSWCNEDFIEVDESENSCSIYELGNYAENHHELTIYEQEVQ